MQKNELRNKAIKAINDTIFIQVKEKIDCCQWLRVGRIGVFQDKKFRGSTIFINKKTKEPLKDKVIDRIASIYEKQGSDCWFTDDNKVLGEEYNPNDYEKLSDMLRFGLTAGLHTVLFWRKEKI